jgi:hypothetical protein
MLHEFLGISFFFLVSIVHEMFTIFNCYRTYCCCELYCAKKLRVVSLVVVVCQYLSLEYRYYTRANNLFFFFWTSLYRLESDFTKAWIRWFPEEWGFDGTLSGWYNVGRLVAALSRRVSEAQGTARDVAGTLNTGSRYLSDAANIAAVVEAGIAA